VDAHRLTILEERRISASVGALVARCEPWGGGVRCFDPRLAWACAVFGAGMAGPVRLAEVRELIGWYGALGVVPRIRLGSRADPTLVAALAVAGFVPESFEDVLAHRLADLPERPAVPGLTLREAVTTADIAAWAEVIERGFGDSRPTADVLRVRTRMASHPHNTATLAEIDGDVVGGALLESFEGIATLYATAVTAPYRRRGVHRALLVHRLHLARLRGAAAAIVGSEVDGPTARNALRLGFVPLYAKVTLRGPIAAGPA